MYNAMTQTEDTIVAISTPMGLGAIGIIRLSGSKALAIASSIFVPKNKKSPYPSRQAVLGHLRNDETGEFFDEVILTYYPKPHTYTREEMVEISCHGSPLILEETVRLAVRKGARHAHPGEFTLRAYLNGRIDILQAEAVADLIEASSLSQAKISFNQMGGSLSLALERMRGEMIRLLSHIESSIEFPDEGLRISSKGIKGQIETIISRIEDLIKSYDIGKSLSEGIRIAITGAVNVGKSTLFNALLEKNRAIVTEIPGTTRDYMEEKMTASGAIFTLIDMAGLTRATHPVEKEGIKRGKQLAAGADGRLLMIDASRKTLKNEKELIERAKEENVILLFNKTDLPVRADIGGLKKLAGGLPSMEMSALKKDHISALKKAMVSTFVPKSDTGDEILLHLRQKLILERIRDHLVSAGEKLTEGHPEEYYVEEIRQSLPLFAQLSGEIRTEDVIEEIFSRFCVGK